MAQHEYCLSISVLFERQQEAIKAKRNTDKGWQSLNDSELKHEGILKPDPVKQLLLSSDCEVNT